MTFLVILKPKHYRSPQCSSVEGSENRYAVMKLSNRALPFSQEQVKVPDDQGQLQNARTAEVTDRRASERTFLFIWALYGQGAKFHVGPIMGLI